MVSDYDPANPSGFVWGKCYGCEENTVRDNHGRVGDDEGFNGREAIRNVFQCDYCGFVLTEAGRARIIVSKLWQLEDEVATNEQATAMGPIIAYFANLGYDGDVPKP